MRRVRTPGGQGEAAARPRLATCLQCLLGDLQPGDVIPRHPGRSDHPRATSTHHHTRSPHRTRDPAHRPPSAQYLSSISLMMMASWSLLACGVADSTAAWPLPPPGDARPAITTPQTPQTGSVRTRAACPHRNQGSCLATYLLSRLGPQSHQSYPPPLPPSSGPMPSSCARPALPDPPDTAGRQASNVNDLSEAQGTDNRADGLRDVMQRSRLLPSLPEPTEETFLASAV